MSEQELNNIAPENETPNTAEQQSTESSAPIPAEHTVETPATAPSEPAAAESVPSSVVIEQEPSAAEKRKEEREKRKKIEEEMLGTLETICKDGGTIEALVVERIKGGLRLDYNGVRLFMPASHYSMKRAPQESELNEAIGKTITAHISEIQKDENGRTTIVASRKKLLSDEFFGTVKEGDTVEGTVSSVTSFGCFVDVNGVEGMVHISRMASYRVSNPADIFKKGDKVKATVTGIDKEKGRMALSTKDFVASPWDSVETKYTTGSVVKGTVKRFTEFGTYIELEQGVEGLLRNADLAWGKRGVSASDLLKEGSVIDIAIVNASAEKKRVSLSLKHLSPNPWKTIAETLPPGTSCQATVKQSNDNGLLVSINADFDGFVPRSKVKNVPGKSSFNVGDTFDATVVDSNGDTESLIIAPMYSEEELASIPQRAPRGNREMRDSEPSGPLPEAPSITLMDMLSEEQRSGLSSN